VSLYEKKTGEDQPLNLISSTEHPILEQLFQNKINKTAHFA